MKKSQQSDLQTRFADLVAIMARLRSEEGCPWDKEQSHESLRPYLLEEAFEVLEAIDKNDSNALKEELGDLLLQIVFHAQIASEERRFEIADVIDEIRNKLIRRHPNVFGDAQIKTAKEQSENWEKLKQRENKRSVVDGVPKALSALLRAWRVQQKAAVVGFDWEASEPVWSKIHEEIDELQAAVAKNEPEQIEEEFGDLLFALVNLSRFLNINPEDALRKTTEKFIRRFREIEREYEKRGANMTEASLEELDEVWQRVKAAEKRA